MNLKESSFNTFPFIELKGLGFRPYLLNENSNWNITEQTLAGWVNGYFLVCNVPRGAFGSLLFIKAFGEPVKAINIRPLEKEFAEKGLFFELGGLQKQYNTKNYWPSSLNEISSDLLELTELMKRLEIEPITEVDSIIWPLQLFPFLLNYYFRNNE